MEINADDTRAQDGLVAIEPLKPGWGPTAATWNYRFVNRSTVTSKAMIMRVLLPCSVIGIADRLQLGEMK